jgi:hypothetical protein
VCDTAATGVERKKTDRWKEVEDGGKKGHFYLLLLQSNTSTSGVLKTTGEL